MENFYYAQITEENICYAVTQTSGIIIQDDMIAIDSYNLDLLGKLWTGTEWVDNPNP
jgi:hypothetical protein